MKQIRPGSKAKAPFVKGNWGGAVSGWIKYVRVASPVRPRPFVQCSEAPREIDKDSGWALTLGRP